jgi:hypothetical protein
VTEHVSSGGIPVTWPDLIIQYQDAVNVALEMIADDPRRLAKVEPPWTLASELGGPAETLSAAAVLFGPERCRPYMEAITEFLPLAIEEILRSDISAIRAGNYVRLLSYLNVTRCCGAPVPPEASTIESKWLTLLAEHKRKLDEDERSKMAFAALALKELALVPVFIYGGPLPKRFKPGEVFQFNVQGFVRYLAVALEQNASAEDIEPAWRDFVRCFPYKYAAGTLRFVHLMWCARTVMVHFERRPVETVADALHQMIV